MKRNTIHRVFDPKTKKFYEWLDGDEVIVGQVHGVHNDIYGMFGYSVEEHDIDDTSIEKQVHIGRALCKKPVRKK